jgi:hypothetical protein
MTESLQCRECAHYRGALTCDAFPEDIPADIVMGRVTHTQPLAGDNGIRFVPLELTSDQLPD